MLPIPIVTVIGVNLLTTLLLYLSFKLRTQSISDRIYKLHREQIAMTDDLASRLKQLEIYLKTSETAGQTALRGLSEMLISDNGKLLLAIDQTREQVKAGTPATLLVLLKELAEKMDQRYTLFEDTATLMHRDSLLMMELLKAGLLSDLIKDLERLNEN